MIAVSGATGTIGGDLVRRLSAAGAPVRALSRHPEPAPALPGVEWVRADLAEADDLPQALEGADAMFLLTGNAGDMVRLQKNAIAAAARAGVGRVVKLSALGASDHSRSVIGLWHYNVERTLREAGVAWTILRPHHFTQNLLDPLVFDRREGVVRSASGDGRIPFIDTRDIAAAAATVLLNDGHDGRTYTLTGPEALSYGQATEVLSGVLDRPLRYEPETVDEAWARLRAADVPPWLVAARLAIATYQRAGGPTERVTDTVETLTGRQPRTVREFAENHRDALRA